MIYDKLAIGFLCLYVGIIIGLNIQEQPSIQDTCLYCNKVYGGDDSYQVNNVHVLIDKINKDCGSTFLTKKYNETEWSVFKKAYNDGWEKSEYILLSNCLN